VSLIGLQHAAATFGTLLQLAAPLHDGHAAAAMLVGCRHTGYSAHFVLLENRLSESAEWPKSVRLNTIMCFDDRCSLKNSSRKLTLILAFFNTLIAIALLVLGGVYTNALQ
jgi:hypothetical protein